MKPVNKYLNHLNEDFTFVNKVFKLNLLKKTLNTVKSSVTGKTVNKSAYLNALKPIPSMSQDKIDTFLSKYLPNYIHNKMVANKYFNKKYPAKQETNDAVASVTGMIASIDDKKSVQDSIKQTDRAYSYAGTSGGGGSFVLMMMGIGVSSAAYYLENQEFKHRALAFALGVLLILSSIKSLLS
jgi:hypothetical protein